MQHLVTFLMFFLLLVVQSSDDDLYIYITSVAIFGVSVSKPHLVELLDEMYISLNICTKFARTVCRAVISCSSYFAYIFLGQQVCMHV